MFSAGATQFCLSNAKAALNNKWTRLRSSKNLFTEQKAPFGSQAVVGQLDLERGLYTVYVCERSVHL